MSRTNRMQTGAQNPANYFFQWKSDHQKFCYYDKVKQENVFVELPFKFLALSRYKTIKGWNQKKEGAIISNEVKNLKDTMTVVFYPKNGNDKIEIAKGAWNDIKETVDNWDGRYTESVYIMLPSGEVANIQLNGASLSTWFEFQKNQQDKFFDNWVTVNAFKEGKQGAVNYTFPVFEWGGTLNKAEQDLAEAADAKIESYEESYFGKEETVKEPYRERSEVDKYEMNKSRQPEPPSEIDANLAMLEASTIDDDDLDF